MSYLSSYISDASEKVRDKAKILLETMKKSMTPKNLEKLLRNTCNEQQHKSILGFYDVGHRSAISEAGTSRIAFNRNKSTLTRRNIASSSRYNAAGVTPDLISTYNNYEVPDLPRTKRVASVIKTNPKVLVGKIQL